MVISTMISDLRETPYQAPSHINLPASPYDNPLQTSQLLLGEYVVAHEEFTNEFGEVWLKVNALQQKHFDEQIGWQGYPGWILKEHAIEVEQFPAHNLVVKKFLTSAHNSDHQEFFKLSIGTRLQGYKPENSDYWIIDTTYDLSKNLTNCIFIHQNDVYELYDHWDISEQELRYNIVQSAKQFLGADYSWGGRSAQTDQVHISGADCSATVHLSYLANGLQIPRMSHEQFLAAREIEDGKNMLPGDLIFFSTIPELRRADLHHIDHIMLYIGDGMLLESTMAGDRNIRIFPCSKRLGYNISEMKSGDVSNTVEDKFYVYFASYLHDPDLIMQLRQNATRYNTRLALQP